MKKSTKSFDQTFSIFVRELEKNAFIMRFHNEFEIVRFGRKFSLSQSGILIKITVIE